MLFGHNPEFTDLAHRLSSETIDMSISAFVEFNFDTKAWSDVGEINPDKGVFDYQKK
jgi:phosphohistidine phosphatase